MWRKGGGEGSGGWEGLDLLGRLEMRWRVEDEWRDKRMESMLEEAQEISKNKTAGPSLLVPDNGK